MDLNLPPSGDAQICPKDGCGRLVDDHRVGELREHLRTAHEPMKVRSTLHDLRHVTDDEVLNATHLTVACLVGSVASEPDLAIPAISFEFDTDQGPVPRIMIAMDEPELVALRNGIASKVDQAVREAKAETRRRRRAASN